MAYPWKHVTRMYDTYCKLVKSRTHASRLLKANEARRLHLAMRFVCAYHVYCQACIGDEALDALGDMVQALVALLDGDPWPSQRAEGRSFMSVWANAACVGIDQLPVDGACRYVNNLLWLNDFDLDDAIAHNTRKIT